MPALQVMMIHEAGREFDEFVRIFEKSILDDLDCSDQSVADRQGGRFQRQDSRGGNPNEQFENGDCHGLPGGRQEAAL